MTRHNKKRNTGLLYEFLVREVAEAIIEGNEKKRDKALAIVKEHFKPGTELYKEFRLFHSLAATTVGSDSVAEMILNAARVASKKCNESKLDREKSMIIRSINHGLDNPNFFNKKISEYKIFATIQTLLNEWRSDEYGNIVQHSKFQQQLKEWLLIEKSTATLEEVSGADPLVEKLMLKKLNEKYSNKLSDEQADLIRSYVFAKDEDSQARLAENLEAIKKNALSSIDSYLTENAGKDRYMEDKLKRAKTLILEEAVSDIDDTKVAKFLDMLVLSEECKER